MKIFENLEGNFEQEKASLFSYLSVPDDTQIAKEKLNFEDVTNFLSEN